MQGHAVRQKCWNIAYGVGARARLAGYSRTRYCSASGDRGLIPATAIFPWASEYPWPTPPLRALRVSESLGSKGNRGMRRIGCHLRLGGRTWLESVQCL
jgi:hypothetical protein